MDGDEIIDDSISGNIDEGDIDLDEGIDDIENDIILDEPDILVSIED